MTEIEGKYLYEDKKELEKRNLEISRYARKLEGEIEELKKKLDFFMTETVAGKEYRPKKEVEELEAQIEKMKSVLELAYKSLCRYETNINGVGITITAESEKELFCKWLKDVEHLIGKE